MNKLRSPISLLALFLASALVSCSALFPARDDAPPTVSITSPSNGAALSGTVSITASATDDKGVFKVSFYVDGGFLAECVSKPYAASWDTTTTGTGAHTISAKAFDTSGNEGDSAVISVTTSGGGGTGTVYSKDFEAFAIGDSWDKVDTSDSSIAGFVYPTTSVSSSLKIAADPAGGGRGKVFHAVDSTAAGETATVWLKFSEVAKGEVSLDLYIAAESSIDLSFGHLAGESTLSTGAFTIIQKKAGSDAWIYASNASGALTQGGSLGLGAWRSIKFSFDSSVGKYNLYVDGVKVLGDQGYVESIASVNYLSICGNPDAKAPSTTTYSADFYIDTIKAVGSTSDVFAGAGTSALPAPSPYISQGVDTFAGVLFWWPPVTGAVKYRVYRSDSSNGTFSQLDLFDAATTDAEHYMTSSGGRFFENDVSAVPGQHYFYKASTIDSGGKESALSDAYEGWANKPGTPTGASATKGTYGDRVAISWTAASGTVSGYHIYRSTAADGSYAGVGYLNNTGTSVSDSSVVAGTHYFYKVAALDSGGNEGDQSSPGAEGWASAVPVPTGVSATQGSYGDKVTVSWTAADGVTTYMIYRSDSASGSYAKIGAAIGQTSYDDKTNTSTTLVAGTTYYYKVSALLNGDEGALSANAASGYAYAIAPPTGLTASDNLYLDKISLSWTAAPGATGYKIFSKLSTDSTFTLLATVGAVTSYDDGSVYYYGVNYQYQLTALFPGGVESSNSSTATGSFLIKAPPYPTLTKQGTTSQRRLYFTWTGLGDCTYEAYIYAPANSWHNYPSDQWYNVAGYTDPNPSDPSGTWTKTVNLLIVNGSYYAKVRAIGANGKAGEWATTSSVYLSW
jgi:fibronectin type 3 domain-containing protein